MPITVYCQQCGQQHRVPPVRVKSFRYCSKTCRANAERSPKGPLTAERLRELFVYDSDTGAFQWRATGQAAGTVDPSRGGYYRIQVDRRLYAAHRLAWLYVHGTFPAVHIDHINRIPTDNRISNLRPVTHAENLQNRIAPMHHSKSRLLGVTRDKTRWRADINIKKKKVYLGGFPTAEAAHEAYMAAKRKHHISVD